VLLSKQLVALPPIFVEKLDGRHSPENGKADLELCSLGREGGDGVREGDVAREETELLENGSLIPADVLVAGDAEVKESKVSRARRRADSEEQRCRLTRDGRLGCRRRRSWAR